MNILIFIINLYIFDILFFNILNLDNLFYKNNIIFFF